MCQLPRLYPNDAVIRATNLPAQVEPTVLVRYYFRSPSTAETSPADVRFFTLIHRANISQVTQPLLFLLAFIKELRYLELLTLYMIEFQLFNPDESVVKVFSEYANTFIHFYTPFRDNITDEPLKGKELLWNAARFLLINFYIDHATDEERALPLRNGIL